MQGSHALEGSAQSPARAQHRPAWWRVRRRGPGTGGLEARLSILRSVPELAGCTDSQLRTLLQYVDEVSVRPGFRVATEGQSCSQLMIVVTGRLRVELKEGGCGVLVRGDTFGWTAMWERGPNGATVVAETDARLLVLSRAQFRAVQAVTCTPHPLQPPT